MVVQNGDIGCLLQIVDSTFGFFPDHFKDLICIGLDTGQPGASFAVGCARPQSSDN